MNTTKTQFIIAAPTSNSGKTTITLGLLRLLKNKGYATQSFKVGPDYIDPKFHKIASGNDAVNLDLYMMNTDDILATYANYSAQKDVICVEGVMGLFDGAIKAKGSTAEMAKLLKLPIILVINAKAVAYSVAPLIYGFKNFDPSINIAGVIFNNVNTKSHYQFLKEACIDVGVKPLGYVPFIPDCEIPSRHLGLSINKIENYSKSIDKLAIAFEKTINISNLLQVCKIETNATKPTQIPVSKTKITTIAVAKDEAFNFSYVQNIACFKNEAKVIYFSPMNDKELPKADLVYFPGGYPEYYCKALANNKTMLTSTKNYADNGGKIIAECGGMMYLGKSIIDKNGKEFKMANIFDYQTSMKNMKLSLGYRTVTFDNFTLKGHEFHYSTLQNDSENDNTINVYNAKEKQVETKIFRYKNVISSYVHYYLGNPQLFKKLIDLLSN